MVAEVKGDTVELPSGGIWQVFQQKVLDADSLRGVLLEKDGRKTTYDELLSRVEAMRINLHMHIEQHLPATNPNNDRFDTRQDLMVALFLPNGMERICVILALANLGIPWVPLSPILPADRIRYILADSGANLVLHSSRDGYSKKWGELDIKAETLCCDEMIHGPCVKIMLPTPEVAPKDKFCTLYTSGSTGLPKGVELTHGNLVNRLQWYWLQFPFAEGEVACSKTTILFVDFITETLAAILAGVSCLLLNRSDVQDVENFACLLNTHKVTRLSLVPSLLSALCQLPTKLDSIGHVVCSGETLEPLLAEKFLSRYSNVTLSNFYGSTEVTGDVTAISFRSMADVTLATDAGRLAIGRPVANCSCYVVSSALEIVEDGEIGELYVGGACIAAGYKNKNPETFTFSLFQNKRRCFRTGDLASVKDGVVYFQGRDDSVVKVRGQKVNLLEVQAALKQLLAGTDNATDEAAQVCVIADVSLATMQTKLYAFYSNSAKTPEEVTSGLKSQLVDYMWPLVLKLDPMPLQATTGKIDRAALKRLIENRKAAAAVPLNTAGATTGEVVLSLVAQILELPLSRVTKTDNFFALGGNSLAAARLIASLRDAGRTLVFQHLMAASHLAEVIACIDGDSVTHVGPEIVLKPLAELSSQQLQELLFALIRSFTTEEPLGVALEIKSNPAHPDDDGLALFTGLIESAHNSTLNRAALIGGRMMGLTICSDASKPDPDAPPHWPGLYEYIRILLTTAEHQALEMLRRKSMKIMENNLLYSDANTDPATSVAVFQALNDFMVEVAVKEKFDCIITCDTSPATQEMDERIYGFKLEAEYDPRELVVDNFRPFGEMEGRFRAKTMVKYLQ